MWLQLFTASSFSQPTSILHTSDTVILEVTEAKYALDNGVKIKYSSYSHEHSSSSPDEPFQANVGVYNFEITTSHKTETITIYAGTDGKSSPLDWESYKITLLSVTPDQRKVVVHIALR